jgi:hypothetical protein
VRLLQRILSGGSGSVFCYSHPHNLDSTLILQRFADLCDLVAEYRELGRVRFRKFIRELPCGHA